MKLIDDLNKRFENGMAKDIFDHIRNLLICSFLVAIGTNQFQEKNDVFLSVSQGKSVGIAIIIFALILIVINSWDGVRYIKKANLHALIVWPLVLLYLFVVVKVLLLGWDFRILSF